MVRNSVPPGGRCQAPDQEFLQLSSDGFRWAPWTFGTTGSMITLTCGICSSLLGESDESSKWGVRETGKVLEPLKHQDRVWARHPTSVQKHACWKIRLLPLDYSAPRPSFPHSSYLGGTVGRFSASAKAKVSPEKPGANLGTTQILKIVTPENQKLNSIIHRYYPEFYL
jgi:hypothetical protein